MGIRQNHIDKILSAAQKISKSGQSAFLDGACADDADLRQEIELLLAQMPRDKDLNTLLTPNPLEPEAETVGVKCGDQLGHYKLLSILGHGGFGTVFLAEQRHPIHRRVAIKVLKAGMDTKQVIARFEIERQVLALLDHPNIARVFDAGTTPLGRPYFVMEHVKGIPITEACDLQLLDTTARIELMACVCDAVQHAHTKGIIHRDLKPSNILVSLDVDGVLRPKIIDFGVAKAIAQPFVDMALVTQVGQVIGTPAYMSPEQADLNELDIDTRTDVYSLGIILYEILAGTPPFSSDQLTGSGLKEMRRVICEEEPPRPSNRLALLESDDAAKIATARQIQLDSLLMLLRQELEWIPLKAMQKLRGDRYSSAMTLSEELRRYLAGEPLLAGPESNLYRLRKLIRRNRSIAITIVTFTLLLATFAIATTFLWLEAVKQATYAEQKSHEVAIELNRRNALYDFLINQKQASGILPSIRDQHHFFRSGNSFKRSIDLAINATKDDPTLRLDLLDLLLLGSTISKHRQMLGAGWTIQEVLQGLPSTLDNASVALTKLRLIATLHKSGNAMMTDVLAAYEAIPKSQMRAHAKALAILAQQQLHSNKTDTGWTEATWISGRQNALKAYRQLQQVPESEQNQIGLLSKLQWHYAYRANDREASLQIYEEMLVPLCRSLYPPENINRKKIEHEYTITTLFSLLESSKDLKSTSELIPEALIRAESSLTVLLEEFGSAHRRAWQWMNNLAVCHADYADHVGLLESKADEHRTRAADLWDQVLWETSTRQQNNLNDTEWYLQNYRHYLPKYAPSEEAWPAWLDSARSVPSNRP